MSEKQAENQSQGEKKNLCAALVKAQCDARAVAKDSQNQFHRYKYASSEAIIEEARTALGGAGLALSSAAWRFEPASPPPELGRPLTQPGDMIGRVHVDYELVHVSGESKRYETSSPVVLEKGRPADKAESGAITLNLGYFLRGLLLLPREDESVAVDQRDDRRQPAAQPRPMPPEDIAGAARQAADADGVDPAFVALTVDRKKRIKEATTPQQLADVVAEAKADGHLPPGLLEETIRYAREVHEAKRKAAAPGQAA